MSSLGGMVTCCYHCGAAIILTIMQLKDKGYFFQDDIYVHLKKKKKTTGEIIIALAELGWCI